MSRFSGKCDFCDMIDIFGLDHIINCDVYVGNNEEPLKITCREDCIPYYPYVVSMSSMDTKNKNGYIRLTTRSWVDIEEERYGHFNIHDYYRSKLEEEIRKAREAREGEGVR